MLFDHVPGTRFFVQGMLPSEIPIQAHTGGSWFAGIVLYCHRNYAHPVTIYHQSVHAIHAIQNGAQMHMSLTPKVTHVICERCDYHPITIQDVTAVMTIVGQDASLLVDNLRAPYPNSIPIVYSNWLQDYNSRDVLLSCTEYLVYRI